MVHFKERSLPAYRHHPSRHLHRHLQPNRRRHRRSLHRFIQPQHSRYHFITYQPRSWRLWITTVVRPTMPLLPGSPAIGAGASFSSLTTDQARIHLTGKHPFRHRYAFPPSPWSSTQSRMIQIALACFAPRGDQVGQNPRHQPDNHVRQPPHPADRRTIEGSFELSGTTGTLTIEGPGPDLLSIDNSVAGGSVFTLDTGCAAEIEGLAIMRQYHFAGGASTTFGTLTINDSVSTRLHLEVMICWAEQRAKHFHCRGHHY